MPLTGRTLVPLPLSPDGPAVLDLDRLDAALAAGARTVLLCQPHNPWGRVFTRGELEGLRDVVVRHGARVISDEVHAPLVLKGATHVPYATLDGTAAHTSTVLSAAKAWNLPGLRCAQVVTGTPADAGILRALPLVAVHGPSPLGVVGALAAYREGTPWLEELLRRLDGNRTLFAELVAELLPQVRHAPAGGDVPRLARRPRAGARRTRRVWRCATGACSSTTGRGSARVGPGTSASTWRPRPTASTASSGGWPRPGRPRRTDEVRPGARSAGRARPSRRAG